MVTEICSCDTQKPYSKCCKPVIEGQNKPENAVDVMRARYTAHVRGEIDFIMNSIAPAKKSEFDKKTIEKWSRSTEWLGLEIISTEKGGSEDDTGVVEFKATFRDKGAVKKHHENATFTKVDGAWYFEDGRQPPIAQYHREAPKVGRNDPCTCGSGKKYKKCCGKNAQD